MTRRKSPALAMISLLAAAAANLLLFLALGWLNREPDALPPRPPRWELREVAALRTPPDRAPQPKESKAKQSSRTPRVSRPTQVVTASMMPNLRVGFGEPDLPGLALSLPGLSALPPAVVPPPVAPVAAPVTPEDRGAARTGGPLPVYPEWARRRGLEAAVTLRIFIDEDGKVERVAIENVEGDPRFGEEARQAVEQWQFRSAIRQGRPTPAALKQTIRFKLVN